MQPFYRPPLIYKRLLPYEPVYASKSVRISTLFAFHSCLVVQSFSSTSKSVLVYQHLFSELPSFPHYLPSKLHLFIMPCYMKHSSLTIFLNSNNPEICGETHCSCNISWCDNVQQRDHEKEIHTFDLVYTLKVSLF
jgi:hypothetical protein